MRLGANTADTICDQSHFFNGTSYHELFEAAEFRDLEGTYWLHCPDRREDLDFAMPFQTGNGIDVGNPSVTTPPYEHDLWCS